MSSPSPRMGRASQQAWNVLRKVLTDNVLYDEICSLTGDQWDDTMRTRLASLSTTFPPRPARPATLLADHGDDQDTARSLAVNARSINEGGAANRIWDGGQSRGSPGVNAATAIESHLHLPPSPTLSRASSTSSPRPSTPTTPSTQNRMVRFLQPVALVEGLEEHLKRCGTDPHEFLNFGRPAQTDRSSLNNASTALVRDMKYIAALEENKALGQVKWCFVMMNMFNILVTYEKKQSRVRGPSPKLVSKIVDKFKHVIDDGDLAHFQDHFNKWAYYGHKLKNLGAKLGVGVFFYVGRHFDEKFLQGSDYRESGWMFNTTWAHWTEQNLMELAKQPILEELGDNLISYLIKPFEEHAATAEAVRSDTSAPTSPDTDTHTAGDGGA